MCVIGIPGKEKKSEEKKKFGVIMAKNFPQLMTGTQEQIQEAQKMPSRINTCFAYHI